MNKFLSEISICKYIYYNFFSKKIIRHGKGKIIPYKNTVIDLSVDSEIHIYDSNIILGINKLHGSKVETYLRLREKARWEAIGYCEISYGSTIEITQNAKLETGYFTMNSNSVLIASDNIIMGDDVMIARNVILFDSDFHSLIKDGKEQEKNKKIQIGNHVWIGVNAVILKGVSIADGVVVAANTIVTKDVEQNSLVVNPTELIVLDNQIEWKR